MGNKNSLEYQQTGLGFADLTTKEGKEEINNASRAQLRNTVRKLVVELKVRHGIIALLSNQQVTDRELESKDCFNHQVRIVREAVNVIKELNQRVEEAEQRVEEAEDENNVLKTEIEGIREGIQKVTGLGQAYKTHIKGLEAQIQEAQNEIFSLRDINKQLRNELSKGKDHSGNNEKYQRCIKRSCKNCEYLMLEMELIKLNDILQSNEESTVLKEQLDTVKRENQKNKTLERQLSRQLKETCAELESTRHQLRELDEYFTDIERQKGVLQQQMKEEREEMLMQIQQLQCDLNKVEGERKNINLKMNTISQKVGQQEEEYNNLVIKMVEDHKQHINECREKCRKIQHLEEQVSENKKARRCVVCLERLKCVAYMPCKHLATCEQCDHRLSQRVCPIDRTQIEGSVKIYN
ncbi:GRIP1-associated protein 1-like isoform X2 [Anneissia japonica]|nr:GRIP1-associated protein 1-like isoform X2 [Anneissia japonica]XP_033109553.1 GRIP1-associated protein 1-like isoform X2 [Anneissia japonica]XP_033109554.1 GRIP1-associated protein 1-like isoform X2 [Anneissia japonica]XP_033109555.1 GRIP1-associated protein 1-like isoform X2 [Anneissia japonica]XP_033109556.1 GRIP1-associated protein 1-like isoform X2 [Anneissia japonica]